MTFRPSGPPNACQPMSLSTNVKDPMRPRSGSDAQEPHSRPPTRRDARMADTAREHVTARFQPTNG
jgi:hypothetical protein